MIASVYDCSLVDATESETAPTFERGRRCSWYGCEQDATQEDVTCIDADAG